MRLIPNEYANFAYSISFFRVEKGGTIRLQTADGTTLTLVVRAGDHVNLPVRRIYQIGTTASGFQTEMFANRHNVNYYTAVPYAPGQGVGGDIAGVILLDQGGGAILTDNGYAIYY